MKELPLEWWYRQIRSTRITKGANEVLYAGVWGQNIIRAHKGLAIMAWSHEVTKARSKKLPTAPRNDEFFTLSSVVILRIFFTRSIVARRLVTSLAKFCISSLTPVPSHIAVFTSAMNSGSFNILT
jgi:hypothetical protein